MQSKRLDGGYLIRLVKDEKIQASLQQFVKEHKIPSGILSGIGAIKNARLGAYNLESKQYKEKTFPEETELLNLTGNISWIDNEPTLHCHAIVSKQDLQLIGGHLFEAEVAVTVEIFLTPQKTRITRKFDNEIGLNLLDLED